MDHDKVEYKCPECDEPVDDYGDSFEPIDCVGFGVGCTCPSCGGGSCDNSC